MPNSKPYPRIAMFWAPVRGDRSPSGYARHDLIVVSPGQIGMEPDAEPSGLADGYTPESVEVGKRWLSEVRRENPGTIIFAAIDFYEYGDDALPEDHPWWLRKNGEREQFWPGTHRMDWYNPDYRAHVVRQTLAAKAAGFDGAFYDNLRDEPEPWIKLLTAVREQAGEDFPIIANVGYATGEYQWVAPYLNGFMYESGWSHRRAGDWDECIAAFQKNQELHRRPTYSIIERFETIRDRAGWPNDPRKGQPIPRDPQARRWTMCYALTIGDFYYLFSDSTSHQHDWYPEYDVKIGFPKKPGERVNAFVWQREYDKALVVVNLPGAPGAHEVELDREAKDSLTGETGRHFTIPPGDGRILVYGG